MTGFWQGISLSLIAVVLIIIMGKNSVELSVALVIGAGCMVVMFALAYLQPVMDLIERLQDMSGLDSQTLKILLKAVGVGLVTEIAHLICTDAGNATLGKTVQLLGAAVMLWLSLPLIEQMLDLVENVMGNV